MGTHFVEQLSVSLEMPFNPMLDDMEMTIIHELVHHTVTSLPTVKPAAATRSRQSMTRMARSISL